MEDQFADLLEADDDYERPKRAARPEAPRPKRMPYRYVRPSGPPAGEWQWRLVNVMIARGLVHERAKRKGHAGESYEGQPNGYALAALTGINHSTCLSMMKGDLKGVSLNTLAKLCHYLQCQPADLLTWQPYLPEDADDQAL